VTSFADLEVGRVADTAVKARIAEDHHLVLEVCDQ
jgi:hypothetical protein